MSSNLRKLFIIFSLIAISQALDGKDDDGFMHSRDELRNLAGNCKEQEQASEDDIETMVNMKLPTTQTGKCLSACMMEQLGIISDAVFSPTHFVELSRMVFENDEQKINVAKEIANTCSTIRDQERCNLSFLLLSCIKKEVLIRRLSDDVSS